jgi:hypothetical protein
VISLYDIYICCCKPPALTLVSCSDYSSTFKMEAICSSETSVDLHWITRRYIPEDSTLHNHRCENLKSDKMGDNVHMYRNVASSV